MSKEEVAKLLEVGRDTVFRWAKRKKETGSLFMMKKEPRGKID